LIFLGFALGFRVLLDQTKKIFFARFKIVPDIQNGGAKIKGAKPVACGMPTFLSFVMRVYFGKLVKMVDRTKMADQNNFFSVNLRVFNIFSSFFALI
jgi:hypothetical protein